MINAVSLANIISVLPQMKKEKNQEKQSRVVYNLTLDSLKGQNLGFPLRPYLSNWAPFLRAVIAWHNENAQKHEIKQTKQTWQIVVLGGTESH